MSESSSSQSANTSFSEINLLRDKTLITIVIFFINKIRI